MEPNYTETWEVFFDTLREKCEEFENLELVDPGDFHFYTKAKMKDSEVESFKNLQDHEPPATISYCSQTFGYLQTVDETYYVYVNYQSDETKKPAIVVQFLTDDVFCLIVTSSQELRMALNKLAAALAASTEAID